MFQACFEGGDSRYYIPSCIFCIQRYTSFTLGNITKFSMTSAKSYILQL